MKKLFIPLSLILIFGFFNCKKETSITETQPQVEPTAKPPGPTPSILQWQKTYGSSVNELGFAITNASDGGYVLAGSTVGNNGDVSGNHGGSDAWIVKLNNTGNIVWQKCFGGTGGDYAYDIVSTSDGGYIFSGATSSSDGDISGFHGAVDAWVVKLSATGTIEWQKVLGGSATERALSVIVTSTGEYLVAGYTNSTDGDVSGNHGNYDSWIVKLSSAGNTVWTKTYGGSLYDVAATITEVTDGFMISAGAESIDGDLSTLTHHGGRDLWLYKINSNGDLQWQKTYGGSGEDNGGNIRMTSDGGFVFSSTTTSNNGDVSGNHGYFDTWVVKLNATGNIVWQKCFGGTDMDNAGIMDIDAAGNILLVGYTFSRNGDIPGNKGGSDLWILQLDQNGNKLNSNVLGGKKGDTGEDAVATTDGMYMSVGRTESNDGDVSGNHGLSDIWVVKFKF